MFTINIGKDNNDGYMPETRSSSLRSKGWSGLSMKVAGWGSEQYSK